MSIILDETWILDQIYKDEWMMHVLKTASKLNLPDWWIGAGFVRNKVWDVLHGFEERTPLNDIDLVYFFKGELSEEVEKKLDQALGNLDPSIPWSTKNLARMHLVNEDENQYENATEGISKWVETPTCVGVKLKNEKLFLTAPHGVEDLLNLIVRPIPIERIQNNPELYIKRIKGKNWTKIWPKLKIIMPQ